MRQRTLFLFLRLDQLQRPERNETGKRGHKAPTPDATGVTPLFWAACASTLCHDRFPQKRWMRVQASFSDPVDAAYDTRNAGDPANAAP